MRINPTEMVHRQLCAWGVESVLEIGCGEGGVIGQMVGIPKRTGVDLSLARLAVARSCHKGVTWDVGDVRWDLDRLYDDDAFNAVILFDVLEHFHKEESWGVLEQAERIAAGVVVVWGPLGQEGMDRYNKDRENHDGMYHQCVLEEREFADRGYATMVFPKYWEWVYDADWTADALLAFKNVG